MAISYSIVKHAACYPTNVLAAKGGEHMLNIKVSQDMDNGTVVAADAWQGMQYYSMKASTGVEALILEQAKNGNWYIQITDAGDGVLLREAPVIEEEYNHEFQLEENFYNASGDKVNGYRLHEFDVIELSEAAFDGTPVAGKALTIENYKWKVAA